MACATSVWWPTEAKFHTPAALRISRRLLRELEASIVEPAMAKGWDAVMAHWPHPDVKEGPTAFAEKREPRWADP